jgi:beta-glucanase (GH16 family)
VKKIALIIPIFLILSFSLNAQTENLKSTPELNNQETKTNEPKLTWSDEFDGTGAPNPAKWDRPEYNRRPNSKGPDGWWSKEDSYLDGNGNLVIRVRKIADKNKDGDPFDYSVGAVRTLGKFKQLYGRYDIRCQLPKQQGWWVAFWMMQGNVGSEVNAGVDGSEVDIMEAFGWTNKINHAVHYDGYGTAHKSVGKNELISGIREGFHTYTLDWYPDKYIFYVDGVEKYRTQGGGVCNQPGYVKITGEISTEDWAINSYWSNDPAKAAYPDSFVVDYVRVYELSDIVNSASVGKKQQQDMKLFPNPVNDMITLNLPTNELSSEKPEITIINSTGELVKSFKQLSEPLELSVADLKEGLYFMIVRFKDSLFSQKFIKN